MSKMRAGDWICPGCDGVVFASKQVCRCGTRKKAGDWTCSKCNDLVFGSKSVCRCGNPRVAATTKPGDWTCPSCKDHVFARKSVCRCGTSKPVADKPSQPPTNDDTLNCCVVCMTNAKEMMIKPCKHVCVCNGCVKQLKTCPICRSNIVDTERIFIV